MPKTTVSVGPHDHGRSMPLDEFDQASGAEGYLYELGRGAICVTQIPGLKHLVLVNAIRRQISELESRFPELIHVIATGSECKILLAKFESERHPDLAVYKSPPTDDQDLWSTWIPDLVVEVVSPGSEQRDYVEKREEYLQFGIREYWIVDEQRQEVLVLRRSRGEWLERVVRPGEIYRTRVLPGLEFDCEAVFRAARAV